MLSEQQMLVILASSESPVAVLLVSWSVRLSLELLSSEPMVA